MFMKAYPDTSVDLWDKNIVNGEYIIAYELNSGLDHKIQDMIPKVCLRNAFYHSTSVTGSYDEEFSI